MKILIILLCFVLSGCAAAPQNPVESSEPVVETAARLIETIPETEPVLTETVPVDPIAEMVAGMSAEEKVGQLFLARCDDSVAISDIASRHLGGFVLFGKDFKDQTKKSMIQKIESYQAATQIPLLIAVDEEGGTVNRVSYYSVFRSSPFPSPRSAYAKGGMVRALEIEEEKCHLLSSLGINVNLGPVCDITTDTNAFMYQRSLGQDAKTTGSFIGNTVYLMSSNHIGSVLKHFPGYGNNTDTHTGIAIDSRDLAELKRSDLLPFIYGIEAGADAVMVSHTVVKALDETLPASLSPAVHTFLRQELGFGGVIITDDLGMQAVTDQFGAAEAAVLAVLAGNDMLCATDYRTQYDAVLAAVLDGRIREELLDSAVYRVLSWKTELGLL